MRILVFDIPASSSGALTILESFFTYISENDKKHEWCFVVGTDTLKAKNENAKIIQVHKKNIFSRIIWEIYYAQKLVKQYRPDVVLSLQNTPILFTSLPQVVYVHQSLPFLKDRKWSLFVPEERKLLIKSLIYKYLNKIVVSKASKIIVQSRWMKDALKKEYNVIDNNVVIIPPFLKLTSVQASKQYNSKNDVQNGFFYPAGPFVYKNYELIVDAVKILKRQQISPIVFFTIDGNENKYTKKLFDSTKFFESNFRFLGHLSRDKVFDILNMTSLVFPSYIETYGLPLLEAKLLGRFILASDRSFSREVLNGYNLVYYFNPFSADDLAEKMIMHIKEKDIVKNSRKNSLDVHKKSSWEKVVTLLEDIYSKR